MYKNTETFQRQRLSPLGVHEQLEIWNPLVCLLRER